MKRKNTKKKAVVRIIKYLSAKNNNFSNWLDQFLRIRWKIWLFETVQTVLCTLSLSWSKFHKELSHNFLRVSTQSRMHLGVSNIYKGCWEILGVLYSTEYNMKISKNATYKLTLPRIIRQFSTVHGQTLNCLMNKRFSRRVGQFERLFPKLSDIWSYTIKY